MKIQRLKKIISIVDFQLLHVFFLAPLAVYSQQQSFSLELKTHYGFIIAHHKDMRNLIKGHVPAVELNFNKVTFGKQEWEQIYNYPEWGFSFLHIDLANPEQLGTVNGIYPYIKFPLIKKNKWMLFYRLGSGVGWISRPFDRVDNYKNNAIGTHLNVIISNTLETQITIKNRLYMLGGLSLTHFSNGAWKPPNLGINIPSIHIGFAYWIVGENTVLQKDTIYPVNKKIDYILVASLGIKEVYPIGGKKYGAYSLSFQAGKTISNKSKIGLGYDVFYSPSLIKRFEKDSVFINNKYDVLQFGFHISYELLISRFSIYFHNGAYIHTLFKDDGTLYNRMGMRYAINKHFIANLSLKTHLFKADFIEFGLGYRF